MVEQESKPAGATAGNPAVPPHPNTESGVFLKAVIPEVESHAPLPFGPGHSNQSGILPGFAGAPFPPSTPPIVEPPASSGGSGGSTIYHLEPPLPAPPVPTFPEPEDPPVLPRLEIPPRRASATPVPPSRMPTSRQASGGPSPSPKSRPADLDHDYSKPLLIAYSIGTTIIILILLIRNAIIGLIEGS
jgi:hypothetical protein